MSFEEAIRRLQEAQGDPEKLTLATLDVVLSVRRPGLRAAIEAAAVPHWFDVRVLSTLLDVHLDAAQQTLDELISFPMVEPFELRRGWNVHESTRLVLRKHLAVTQPERFQRLSDVAAACFSGDSAEQQVEQIYHRLAAGSDVAAKELVSLWKNWDRSGRTERLQSLGLALEELTSQHLLSRFCRARALFCLGWIRAVRWKVEERLARATECLELLQGQDDLPGECDAHDQIGEVHLAAGRLPEALREFEAGQRIMKRLTARDPENADWQRELAASHNKVGSVYQLQGRLPEALSEFEAFKRLMLRLTAHDPENTEWQRDLSVAHNWVGSIFQSQGLRSNALREFKAYRRIMLRLAAHDPENTDWQRNLSIAHNCVGSIYQPQGRLPAALREFEAGQQIMKRLAAHDPENTDWQRDLSASHNHVGSVYQAQGRLTEALREFEAGQQIMNRLTLHDPENTEWQSGLSVSHNHVGSVYQSQGRLTEALREFEAYRQIMLRLTAHDPENTGWRRELSVAHSNVGSIYQSQGRLSEALREFEASKRIMLRLTAHDPENAMWSDDLRVSQGWIDAVLAKLNEPGSHETPPGGEP